MTARQITSEGKNRKSRIFVATEDCLVRRGFDTLLAAETDLVMCGEGDPVIAQLDLVVSAEPDLVVVDLSFRTDDGEEFIRRLRLRIPAAKVLVISMCDEFSCTQIALGAGAHGYLAKDETASGSIAHIRSLLGHAENRPESRGLPATKLRSAESGKPLHD
jgi:DNA-binding NarL/FixJ family response regulator